MLIVNPYYKKEHESDGGGKEIFRLLHFLSGVKFALLEDH